VFLFFILFEDYIMLSI